MRTLIIDLRDTEARGGKANDNLGRFVSKEEILKRGGVRTLIVLRRERYESVYIKLNNYHRQRWLLFIKLFGLSIRAGRKYIVDEAGHRINLSWPRFLVTDVPKFIVEIALLPLIISLTFLLLGFLYIRRPIQRERQRPTRIDKLIYLRTDLWFGVRAGGSVSHIVGVAKGILNHGKKLLLLSTDQLPLIDETQADVVIIRPSRWFMDFKEIPELVYTFTCYRQAKKIFSKERPDLIYQRYSLHNFSGVLLARRFKIPFVLEYNGSFSWMGKHWGRPLKLAFLSDLIEKINFKYADLIVVVSKAMGDEVIARGIDPKKVLVNPNGVDPEVYDSARYAKEVPVIKKKLGIPEGKILVGFIGTFGKWHGAEVLAQAVKRVVRERPDIHFLFIGDGITLPQVKQIIQQDGVEEYVTFTGLVPQEQAPSYLAACDILTSPHIPNPDGTPFFGSPTKLFEYMAMGKGIVASNLDQIGEILEHEKTAWLVSPGDVEELAEGILRLAQDENLRKQLGQNARQEVIAKYTWAKHVQRILSKLHELGIG